MTSLRTWYLVTAILLAIGLASTIQASEPAFVYETIIPGYYLSHGLDMTVDADGNSYVIASWYQDRQHLDILVVKLDAEGTPLWMVPIVGDEREHDYATDITLDSANDVWITGWTDSPNFPITPDALDNTLTGFRDVFVTKLSTVDGEILYSTFLGGDYVDHGQGITLNDAGEIYLVGSTKSTDFPTTPDAYQDHPSAPLYVYSDVFITKLSPAADSIIYSTYFGGYKNDVAENVALDQGGNIVFAGETNAVDFPLVNPIQSDPHDLFVSRLSSDGSTLQFSTYLGGEDLDRLGGMVLDSEGVVYIAGSTRSINFPTTPGAFQEDFVGEILGCEVPFGGRYNCDDVFVTKLGTDGSGLLYSTYLGGNTIEEGRDLALDEQGRAHVIGFTTSPDFPPNGINFSAAIFLSRFDPTGSELDYSVTVNSGSANAGHGVVTDNNGGVYFTGAINVPAEIYVAKIAEEETPEVTVELLPDDPPVVEPRGGRFGYTVYLTNSTDRMLFTDLWMMVRFPSGEMYGPVRQFNDIRLLPNQSRNAHLLQSIPGYAPLGDYLYLGYCGDYASTVIDSSYFEVEVTSGPLARAADAGWALTGSFVGGDDYTGLPSEFALLVNHPNPFNASTVIGYQLPEASNVKLEVYNVLGEKVATLVDGEQEAGYRYVVWDASAISSGVYFYRLQAGEFVSTKKMNLLK
jgi:hypothetical protein